MSILPAGVEIVAKFLKVLAALVATLLVLGATVAQIVLADPPLNWPTSLDWFLTPRNISILLTALLSGVSVWALVMQLRAPATASDEDMKRVLLELQTLKSKLAADPRIPANMTESFAATADGLARSENPLDRSVAREVAEGDPIEAADRLMAEVGAGRHRNAKRALQAARLYAPFAPSKAMQGYKEAVDLDPTDIWSWIELGRLRQLYGTLGEARTCLAAALQHVTDERDRLVLHNEFGDLLMIEGEFPEARSEYEAGLAIAERLTEQDPASAPAQRDLSISYDRLGDVERAAGNLVAARERYEAALAICEKLAAQDPEDAVPQRDLSVCYNKFGNVERAAGNLGAARQRYEAALAICENLAAQKPGNTERERDLAVSYNKLGDVEHAAGNLGAARERYEAGLAISERLSAQEPANNEWQRDLSISYDRLGDVERADGHLRVARERFEAGLAIRERLAGREPANTEWQRDIFISQAKLAQLAEAEGDPGEALRRFSAAERIVASLVEGWPDHPGFARDLDQVRADVERLQESGG